MNTQSLLWGVPAKDWLTAVLVTIGILILLGALRALFQRQNERKQMPKILVNLLRSTSWVTLIALSFWVGSRFISFPAETQPYLRLVFIILLGIQASRWVSALIDGYFDLQKDSKSEKDTGQNLPQRVIASLVKILVWVIIVLLILENIPYLQISSLIAGLGIGGIAVSLAAQKVIADLLSSITIRLDKPFVTGDLIRAAGFTGKVEFIGLRSTQLRNIDGEELSFSNSDLLSSPIQNFTRMDERRVQSTLPLSYSNGPAKLKALPTLVKELVDSTPNTRFGSFYLTELGDMRLRYTLIYTISSRDFDQFRKAQDAINLGLLERFENAGIVLANPPEASLSSLNVVEEKEP